MTTFPRSPRTLRGAIVAIDPFNPLASVIIFQYNPETMTRSLTAQVGSEEGAREDPLRFEGAAVETIKLKVEIDATDQLETADPTAVAAGIYPQLSALEMMLYPKTATVIANSVLAAIGTIEIIQPEAPMALFVWGLKRVVPIRMTAFSITEQAYDVALNPIRAEVDLDLRVLTYSDYSVTHPGHHIFLAHQAVKEAMAVIGSVSNLASTAGVKI